MNPHRPANFDPIARPYRWLEYLTFGSILEHCRFHFLHKLSTHRRALILGDGDGRFTTRLLTANPQITIDAVDSSAAMLNLLTARATQLGPSATERLRTIHSDALAFQPEGEPYDLVVTHFFLDCLTNEDLNILIAKLRPHLTPGATWLVSEFAIPPTQPTKTIARTVIAALYHAFRILTGLKTQRLPDYTSALRQNGFSRIDKKIFLGDLLTAELWRLNSQPR
jgi:ubiquinone/menaquinone biosynthesis C-methylase UbiE